MWCRGRVRQVLPVSWKTGKMGVGGMRPSKSIPKPVGYGVGMFRRRRPRCTGQGKPRRSLEARRAGHLLEPARLPFRPSGPG